MEGKRRERERENSQGERDVEGKRETAGKDLPSTIVPVEIFPPLSSGKKKRRASSSKNHSRFSFPSLLLSLDLLLPPLASSLACASGAMEERKKLPMKYVYVSSEGWRRWEKRVLSLFCRRRQTGETDGALVFDDDVEDASNAPASSRRLLVPILCRGIKAGLVSRLVAGKRVRYRFPCAIRSRSSPSFSSSPVESKSRLSKK